jgi:four helix bundle protein
VTLYSYDCIEYNQGMKKENVVLKKSFDFSIKIVELFRQLNNDREYVLSKQLLRSGTSIGANVFEAQGSISKKEFIAKIQIAYKESLESQYWIKLLKETRFIESKRADLLFKECTDLRNLLSSIQKTSKGE